MANDVELPPSSFEIDTSECISKLRASLTALTTAVGPKFSRPIDLKRTLGVDAKLSWQVFNVINEPDPLAAVKLVPGEASVNRLITAAEKLGVSRRIGESVREAMADFQRVVQRHAEDREEFDFMASSSSGASSAATAELAFRRVAYRAESNIWGVSADLFGATTIVRLSDDRTTTDEVSLMNKMGCRRLRPDAPTSIMAYRNYGASVAPADRDRVPLDQAAADRYGAHLMPKYCSQPIPPFKTWKRPDGYMSVDVLSREIGRQGAISLTLGQIYRRCPLARGLEGEPYYHINMRVGTPSALLQNYILIDRRSFGPIKPQVVAFRQTPGDENPAVALSAPQLLTRDEIRFLGTGRSTWNTPDLPRHEEMIQDAFNEIGWNPADFDVYRLRIEYPPLHSVIRVQFPV